MLRKVKFGGEEKVYEYDRGLIRKMREE